MRVCPRNLPQCLLPHRIISPKPADHLRHTTDDRVCFTQKQVAKSVDSLSHAVKEIILMILFIICAMHQIIEKYQFLHPTTTRRCTY
jgi:hypothetical protein